MGKLFTLESLREEVEAQYKPVELQVGDQLVTLTNLMRLPKKKRDIVMEKVAIIDADDDDVAAMDGVSREILLEVSDKPQVLKKALGDDFALTMKILTLWMESTQVGEASSSSD